MRLGCLLFVIGIIVAVAGLFAWQLAGDSPGWQLSRLFRILGLVVFVLGAAVGLVGVVRAARRR